MKELVAKQNGKGLMIFAILLSIGFIELVINYRDTLSLFKKNLFGASFITLFLTGGTFYMWYMVLDKRTKLIINRNGLWSSKSKQLTWDRVLFYSFEKRIGKTVTYILKLETQNPGKDFILDITYLDKDYSEIKQAIEDNSAGYNIEYLGITEKE